MGFSGGQNGSISSSSDVALNSPADENVLSYDSSISKWKNADLGGTFVSKGDLVFNVLDYGAGTGKTGAQNATAFQSAQNAVTAAGGGSIWIPAGTFQFSGTVTFSAGVGATGQGTVIFSDTAKWTFGTSSGRTVSNATISGLRLWRSGFTDATSAGTGIANGSVFIEIKRLRGLSIKDCNFSGADMAIYMPPVSGAAPHDNSMIHIDGNRFAEVNYAWYVDQDNLTSSNWGVTADSHFTNNVINKAYITHIYLASIDGVIITGNTMFSVNYASGNTRKSEKRNNIYIGRSDWVHIHNNNMFEAGYESIYMTEAKTTAIEGNLIAWPGQLDLKSGIYVSGLSGTQLTITGNSISQYTKYAIEIVNALLAGSFSGNTCLYLGSSTNSYIGSTDITSINHYRYYFDDAITLLPNIGDAPTGRSGEADYVTGMAATDSYTTISKWGALSGSRDIATVSGATNVNSVKNSNGDTNSYSGLVVMTVKRSDTDTAKNAVYLLLVNKTPAGAGSCVTVSSAGLTTGAASDDPAFTFSLDATNNRLIATPVGSTSGSFTFWPVGTGDIIVA